MILILADALDVPQKNIISFEAWLHRVRNFPPSLATSENPAAMLVDFLETHFVRMSCGGLVLDTAHSVEHSKTLKKSKPVPKELVEKYIQAWKAAGFLRK